MWKVTSAQADVESVKWKITRTEVTVTISTNPRWVVTSLQASVSPAIVLTQFSPRTVEPFTRVTLTADPQGDTSADSYVWRVISGDAIITGTGATRVVRAPGATVSSQAKIGVTAVSGGVSSPEVVATIDTLPANAFRIAADGSLVAIPLPEKLS
jgi:hypothetical protein